jgi:hypothetical protein
MDTWRPLPGYKTGAEAREDQPGLSSLVSLIKP